MTPGADAARLVAQLKRLRRRAFVALSLRYLCVSAAVALLVAEATLVASPADPGPAALLIGAALAAAAAVAVVAASFHAPAMRETAIAVDRRLHLQDRLVTAFQYRDATDAFARLVVQDAVSQVNDVRPASAFPLQVPRWARIAGVAACAAPLVFVLATAGVPRLRQLASDRESSAGGGPAIPAPAESRGAAQASPETAAEAIARGAPRVQAAAPPSLPFPRDGDRGPAPERTPEAASSPARPPGSAVENTGTGVTAGAGSAFRRTDAQSQPATDRGGASRGDGSAGLPQIQQAGGLTGTPALGVADVARAERAADPTREAVYRSAWATSQRAIAQEHIPSALRGYVRQYFVAIRPAEPK